MNEKNFDQLTPQQQTQVLKYLEATNIQDIQQAITKLANFNFDSARAINHKFSESMSQTRPTNSVRQRPNLQSRLSADAQRQLAEYFAHVQKIHEARTLIKLLQGAFIYIGKKLFRGIIYYVPNFIKEKFYYSKFDAIYRSVSKINLEATNLSQILQKGRYVEKPVLLILAGDSRQNQRVVQFLNDNNCRQILNTRFLCYGLTFDHKQVKQIFVLQQERPRIASIVILYQTIFNKKKIITRLNLEQQEKQNNISKQGFTKIIQQYRLQRRHQKNIIIRYNNTILSYYHDQAAQHLMEDQLPEDTTHYHQDRHIRNLQEKQYQQAIQLSKKKQQQRLLLQKKQQQQLRIIQNKKQQRKKKSMSIPPEPKEGDLTVFSFRCPNGSKIYRNFLKKQKLECIYDWIESNLQIEFEDENRNFELLRSYPPVPLGAQKERLLSEIFEQEQQLLVIKQI